MMKMMSITLISTNLTKIFWNHTDIGAGGELALFCSVKKNKKKCVAKFRNIVFKSIPEADAKRMIAATK
jgi:hypothetical protein